MKNRKQRAVGIAPIKKGSSLHASVRHSTRTNKNKESYAKGYFREEVHGSGAQRAAAMTGMFDGRRDEASGRRYSSAPYYKSPNESYRRTKRGNRN